MLPNLEPTESKYTMVLRLRQLFTFMELWFIWLAMNRFILLFKSVGYEKQHK
jgi:hypothetical protein